MTDPCWHCNEPIPKGYVRTIEYKGEAQPLCCEGCYSVASLILSGGMDDYYKHRDAPAIKPASSSDNLAIFDDSAYQASFCQPCGETLVDVDLLLAEVNCAACAWLIERHLSRIAGVENPRVSVSSKRLRLTADLRVVKLSEIASALSAIGYQPSPWSPTSAEARSKEEGKRLLFKVGLAGIGFLQVMMFAVALYAGDISGISEEHQSLMRWFSLAISVPVVLYSASPFFSGAIRAFKARSVTMDVPVATAIGLAWTASIVATIKGGGEVYFDSVVMFTFFLLTGRYLEHRAMHRENFSGATLEGWLPDSANHAERGWIPTAALRNDDVVVVKSGEAFPCDGRVLRGESSADESLLTGESEPQPKQVGADVFAGTHNIDGSLEVLVTAVGDNCSAAQVNRLLNDAMQAKPRITRIVDRISGAFISAVLVLSALTYLWWHSHQPEHAFWIALSVLVVTCPCALSLATPVALTSSVSGFRQRGILVSNTDGIATMGDVDLIIADKTGTLTRGRPAISKWVNHSSFDDELVLSIAAGLEAHSNHPIASAFKRIESVYIDEVQISVGHGVSGVFDGAKWEIAKPSTDEKSGAQAWLTRNEALIASFYFSDALREGASQAINALKARGVEIWLASGDHAESVESVAKSLKIEVAQSRCSPEAKYRLLTDAQAQGRCVLMVGDGLNDVPVIGGADVSAAMAAGASIARCHADFILVDERLEVFSTLFAFAQKTNRIIRQNLAWALGYNAFALPLAVTGFVPPWAAAIGMSLSSLVVVLNALRLSR